MYAPSLSLSLSLSLSFSRLFFKQGAHRKEEAISTSNNHESMFFFSFLPCKKSILLFFIFIFHFTLYTLSFVYSSDRQYVYSEIVITLCTLPSISNSI